PKIDENLINEFSILGYIACAFSTLYSTGNTDLCTEHVKDIKPAEYFKHLLKYKDGRSLEQLTENNTVSWSELFNRNLVEIKSKLNDLLGSSVDELEESVFENKNKQLETDEDEEIWPDWMILAKIGLNIIVDSSSDLGLSNTD
ncbi:2429_t:CDS:2, partial [Cetraspora pellucida]